ncbi:MAG: sigma-70 family RNA polymerase sigma factor [Akkermansiaceae bacterium]|nr:sigma-70 family RNA polymerase sigma factor [Akkermansiaceae bacterium]
MSDYTRWLNGDSDLHDGEMFGALYDELKKIARSRMRGERAGHTLDATALVHEAWLRLEKSAPEHWRDRREFFALAAEAMRRILVESARRRLTRKRGGGAEAVPLEEFNLPVTPALPDDRLLEVHEVLDRLEVENEMDARIVKLRFFGGMTTAEIAALLEVSEMTVQRHWAAAKVWLYRALSEKSS